MRCRTIFGTVALIAWAAACAAFSEDTSTGALPERDASTLDATKVEAGRDDDATITDAAAGADADASDGDGGGKSSSRDYFIATVYPMVVQACPTCHSSGGSGPLFVGPDGAATYGLFKSKGYDVPASMNLFLNEPTHTGPALTTPQKDTFKSWLVLVDGGT